MLVLQTNTLPIRDIQICDGWCLPPCWKRKTIPPWLWCDAVCDYSKCHTIDTPCDILEEARTLVAKKNEGLFLFYEMGDLEGARCHKERIARIQALLDQYD